jgi:DNA polymerase III delta prime subunit
MSNAMNSPGPLEVLIASPALAIEQFLGRHRRWIETVTGCPAAESITFEFYLPFDDLVLSRMFEGIPLDRRSVLYTAALAPVVDRWEIPPETSPRIALSLSRNRDAGIAQSTFGWEPEWRSTPLAIWLKGCTHGFVYANVPYVSHKDNGGPPSRWLLIVNRREMAEVLRVLEAIEPPRKIRMASGRDIPITADGCRWESLVLKSDLEKHVRDDFESFFKREKWFRDHRLPYRRGYLFYGPPGNGKTSAARIMACHPAVRAFGIDFRATRETPYSAEQLSELFEAAAAQAPSLVILEDIDKVGSGDPEAMRQAQNGLLSCMDGLTTEDGVVVVATANDPTPLNNALLKRPGRFDRVVRFSAPAPELRQRYLVSLSGGNLDSDKAAEASLAMDRFSFAQIRETYILAGQLAFECSDEITTGKLAAAARQLRREGKRINNNGQNGPVGFSVAEDQVADS